MNKFSKVMLSILGGVEVTFYMFTPVMIAALWVVTSNLENWTEYFFYAIGLLATIFRAIKIGWLKEYGR